MDRLDSVLTTRVTPERPLDFSRYFKIFKFKGVQLELEAPMRRHGPRPTVTVTGSLSIFPAPGPRHRRRPSGLRPRTRMRSIMIVIRLRSRVTVTVTVPGPGARPASLSPESWTSESVKEPERHVLVRRPQRRVSAFCVGDRCSDSGGSDGPWIMIS
jgi:hypothetical protein